MADIKLQVYRGETPPEHVDFRGEGFRGSPEDEHRTVAEFRTKDEAIVAEIIETAPSVNRLLEMFTRGADGAAGNNLGHLASLVGLDGSGSPKIAVRVYEDD